MHKHRLFQLPHPQVVNKSVSMVAEKGQLQIKTTNTRDHIEIHVCKYTCKLRKYLQLDNMRPAEVFPGTHSSDGQMLFV